MIALLFLKVAPIYKKPSKDKEKEKDDASLLESKLDRLSQFQGSTLNQSIHSTTGRPHSRNSSIRSRSGTPLLDSERNMWVFLFF